MSDCSENKNPLIRNGNSQGQRVIEKLNPGSVEVIDKSVEDWMVWAGKFSDHIQYTSLLNAPAGTMKPFFSEDISARLALIASYDPTITTQYIREKLLYIETEDTNLKEAYTELFDIILSYFKIVDQFFQFAKLDQEFHSILVNHIQSKLLPLESRTFAYYKASLEGIPAQRLILPSTLIDLNIFNEDVDSHSNLIKAGLSSLNEKRYLNSSNFKTHYDAILPDISIFGDLVDPLDRIKYVSQHNFFTSILDEIGASLVFINQLSKKYIDKYLNNWPDHQPNYALYLTTLQLLEASKNHLNELTGRHLDFYYKNVLQLRPLAQSSDKAFLVLELNKITSSLAVKEQTLFMGPKDEQGELITYESTRETVLNKAKIKDLMSIYFGGEEDNIGTQINKGRLFTAPIINSADGLGEKLEGDIISWNPFHIKEYEHAELVNINMPKATLGFAISSHYLRLKEGSRSISTVLNVTNFVKFDHFSYDAYITSEKEWIKIEETNLILTKAGNGRVLKLTFNFTIPADKDPIVAYNKSIHLGNITADEPVLKIVLRHEDSESFIYDSLAKTKISTINLSVIVGNVTGSYNEDGVKNLELHNDSSPLNPTKPFHPWGAEPTVGNSFVIGSDEIFYKKGAKMQLNFSWKDYPLNEDGSINSSALDFDGYNDVDYPSFNSVAGPTYVPTVEILKLSKNKWASLMDDTHVFRVGAGLPILEQVALEVDLSSDTHKDLFLEKDQAWNAFGPSSNRGFVKIKLKNDFGHRDYYNALQSYFKANDDNDEAPLYPYKPTLESFSISYEASCTMSLTSNDVDLFEKRPIQFFNMGPFGDSEQHALLQDSPSRLLNKLIRSSSGNFKSQGAFFMSFENLNPEDTQSVLFQVQEGSEDPLLEKPEEHLHWAYLAANNVWKEFDKNFIGDNTSGLIESGIINFTIPKDASLEHTAFTSDLIWIKCSVKESCDALSKIIGIFPNAIESRRIIPEDKSYPSMTLASGEIKKLYTPEAKIKKIEQPFASFGGTPKEDNDSFYLKASERLRHKNRAITIWDYERLILQAFPDIYKVKCLNHTKISGSQSEGDLIYNEVAPGFVSIITIPNLSNRNDIDPLKPYTKKSVLKNIEDFLKTRTSCQVHICTAQPDFEEVKVKCSIVLKEEYTDTNYYREIIQQETTEFLSPWAFSLDTNLNFGGRIHKSVLIDFIEELPYVEYLTDFELIHFKSSGESSKVDEAIASTARSILVSIAATKHDLNVMVITESSTQETICYDE